MSKSEDYILSFLYAFSAHFVFIVMASLVGVSIYFVEPSIQRLEEPEVIEIGKEEPIPSTPSSSGEPQEELEIPEIEDELWEELPEETPIKDIPEDVLFPDAPKPPKDITKNETDGEAWEAASKSPRHKIPNEGIFGKKKDDGEKDDEGDGKEFFGEEIDGSVLFLFDTSGSMNDPFKDTTRLERLKQELLRAIDTLDETNEFDCLGFSGDYHYNLVRDILWGEMMPATESNKQIAKDWVRGLIAQGSTPTYSALKHACEKYPSSINNMFLVTDGFPDSSTAEIVNGAKKWWKKFNNCKLVCVSIGGKGLYFIKNLASAVGGVYVEVK